MSTPAVIAARALIGVPWRHQGRDPAIGIDCVGLLVLAFGLAPERDFTAYGRMPHDGMLERHLAAVFGAPVPNGVLDARPGDVAAMAYGRAIRHVGIVGDYALGGLSLIHTDSTLGHVTEHPLDGKWVARVRAIYRQGEA